MEGITKNQYSEGGDPPHAPSKKLTYGEQALEEMLYDWGSTSTGHEKDPLTLHTYLFPPKLTNPVLAYTY